MTDKPDYAPGETAIITAFNNSGAEGVMFQSGEQVQFQVTRTDGAGDSPLGNLPWYVTDGVGGFDGYYVDANDDGTSDYGVFPDTDRTVNSSIGITCDISTSGIFFETESPYSIGDTIRLSLNFEHETLQCEARVVRVEPRHGQFGVAVELTSYVFC
jgi:hypothetical protein